jgi:carboxyl-terminal processing protease
MKRSTIYLPFLLALMLAFGMLIGSRLSKPGNEEGLSDGSMDSGKIGMILHFIERDYVDTVNRNELEKNAINGMLEKLDPHSQYVSAEEFNEMNDPLLGSFEGIGVSFRIEKDTITVISPVKGGPSEKLGIMAGDRIVYIDDSLVAGVKVTNRDAMRKLKGPKGTTVHVKILRRGVKGLTDFAIVRDVIPTYSLDAAYMTGENIGYIRLNKFSATTHEEFVEAAKKLKKEGMQKLILDLRGNTGGYLKAATDIADEFLMDGKLIVYTKGKSRNKTFAFATDNGLFEKEEIAVLIDEGSASASEIVAGALQDNDRGIIVGRRSFGKGLVQEQLPMPDGSALRLTVSRYYTPTGRCIQKPYDGDFMKYHNEQLDRYTDGEMMHPDSIHFNDSLKYTTPGGKIVYGGGGIMPDMYVPMVVDSNLYFYNKLANSGLIFQYAFDYTDMNRPDLKKYKTAQSFDAGFEMEPSVFNGFMAYAEKKGIKAAKGDVENSRESIRTLFKAFVARNIYDDEGFYPIYQKNDPVLLKAIEVLR